MRTSPRTCCDAALAAVADGVLVAVRLSPRARADRIDGISGAALKVSVTAPPVDNRANEALLRLLAREWRLPRRTLSLAAGGRSRDKTVHIAGNPAALMRQLGASISSLHPETG